jgi:hypothetical protein
MIIKRFKKHERSRVTSNGPPVFDIWLATAHGCLNEMYGPHPKVCSFIMSESQIKSNMALLRDVYGYEQPQGTHFSIRGLLNNWYAYYHLSYYAPDDYHMCAVGYKFVDDTDAVMFKLKAG